MRTLLIATTALLVSLPATAQQTERPDHPGQHGAHAMGMMGMHCPMMGGPMPTMILHHADELDLSAEQVERIETIRDQADGAAHMQGAMAAHREAADLMAADQPDLTAYEAKLTEAADHMVRAHTVMARAGVETRAVLTAEQRERLSTMDHEGMGNGEGMGHGGAMNHGGMDHAMGEGHAGMMMNCPMMRGMHGAGENGPGAEHH